MALLAIQHSIYMRYQKMTPNDGLRPFVECYFTWDGHADDKVEIQTPPSCKGAIVVNYGDPTWVYQRSTEPVQVPEAFVCGQFLSNFHRIVHHKIGMTGIVFKPTAIHNFFGIRMSQLVNTRMPLGLLTEDANNLVKKVIAASDDHGRATVFDEFLVDRLNQARKRLTIIDDVADYIDETNGLKTVEEVASRFNISKRYLEKSFLGKVGISPKLYSRLKRFAMLSIELSYRNNANWQDLIEKAGLHDQSHLIKEFIKFNNTNPGEYFKNHKEITRFLGK